MLAINLAFKPVAPDPVLYAALAYLAMLQVTALIFNLLPCPGLDGWGIIEPFLPLTVRQWGRRARRSRRFSWCSRSSSFPGSTSWFWNVVYGRVR